LGKKFPQEDVGAGSGGGAIGPGPGAGAEDCKGQPPCSNPSCLIWSHFPHAGLLEQESTQRCLATISHSCPLPAMQRDLSHITDSFNFYNICYVPRNSSADLSISLTVTHNLVQDVLPGLFLIATVNLCIRKHVAVFLLQHRFLAFSYAEINFFIPFILYLNDLFVILITI
jgi:hypothetical protein